MNRTPDNYEINIAKKKTPEDKYGVHWCKIELPDNSSESAEEKLEYLRKLFGDEFNITMKHWVCRGYSKDEWK